MPIAPKSTEEKTSRRDAVAAAVEKNGITDEDVTPEAAAAAAAEVEGEEAQATEGETAGEEKTAADAVGGAKDEDGAAKDKTAAGKKADAKGAKPGEQAKPEAAGKDKPPQGWSPAARELWGKVPPEVKGEIARREKDNARQAEQLNAAKQFIDPVQKALTPFVPLAKALGTSPLALAHDGLQLAAGLRAGDNERKGELIGQLIKRFGGPAILQNINDALVKLGIAQPAEEEATADEGEKGAAKPQARQAQPAVYKDPRLDEFLAEREKEKQRREEQSAARAQQLQEEADREIEKFADEHEFYEDVRLKMKSLYDGGIAKDLEEAYEMALKLDGKIQGILSQRDAAEKAKDKTTSVQRAKTAGSSVKSSPAGAGGAGKPKGIRAALDAAWDGLSGRT